MYEILEQHKSSYVAAFKDIYADVEAGGFDWVIVPCCRYTCSYILRVCCYRGRLSHEYSAKATKYNNDKL